MIEQMESIEKNLSMGKDIFDHVHIGSIHIHRDRFDIFPCVFAVMLKILEKIAFPAAWKNVRERMLIGVGKDKTHRGCGIFGGFDFVEYKVFRETFLLRGTSSSVNVRFGSFT